MEVFLTRIGQRPDTRSERSVLRHADLQGSTINKIFRESRSHKAWSSASSHWHRGMSQRCVLFAGKWPDDGSPRSMRYPPLHPIHNSSEDLAPLHRTSSFLGDLNDRRQLETKMKHYIGTDWLTDHCSVHWRSLIIRPLGDRPQPPLPLRRRRAISSGGSQARDFTYPQSHLRQLLFSQFRQERTAAVDPLELDCSSII